MQKHNSRPSDRKNAFIAISTLMAVFLTGLGVPAYTVHAQVLEEIIVTARKREERLQDVPVAVNVVTERLVATLRIEGIEDLSNNIPGLKAADASGATGGSIYLRGVGSGVTNSFTQQAVAVNIDGVQIDDGKILQAAMLDLAQIEVMRGPQALFFGKNSPGGVIALHTKDPGDQFELMLSTDYEIESREKIGRTVISGPLTENLGGRLALSYSEKKGDRDVVGMDASRSRATAIGFIATGRKDITAPGPQEQIAFAPFEDTFPKEEDLFVRGTLLFQPAANFRARAKVGYIENILLGGSTRFTQRIHCPQGTPQAFIPIDNCKADNRLFFGRIDPDMLAAMRNGRQSDPDGIRDTEQYFASLELNYYFPEPGLALTSITGYFDTEQFNQIDASMEPASLLVAAQIHIAERISQEFRLASDWNKPVNFMVGVYYDVGENSLDFDVVVNSFLNPTSDDPIPVGRQIMAQDSAASSVFAQADWDINEKVNISIGARYSYEKKEIPRVSFLGGSSGDDPDPDIRVTPDKETWTNFSPEATITYFPIDTIMLYVSYKEGFKSGGFDAAFKPALASGGEFDLRYDEETISGFEVGMKSILLADTLTLNATAFKYIYDDLQVEVVDIETISISITNAARASLEGIELESIWSTPIDRLNLRGGLNYLDATYEKYLAGCYTGQTIAQGCNRRQAPQTGAFTAQDLSGTRMAFGPKWTGVVGFEYEMTLTGVWNLAISGYQTYSSSYKSNAVAIPNSDVNSYGLTNAALQLLSTDGAWELYVKGNNLTNEYYWMRSADVPLTGGGTGTEEGTLADVGGDVLGGRRVTLGVKYWFR